MSGEFDAYHVWLGIPANEQPPNHYRLLGIAPFESDLDVIDHAADRQMAHVRTFQSGKHGALSQQILNELAAARLCLLSPDKKLAYDSELLSLLPPGKRGSPGVAVAKAIPVARSVAGQTGSPPAAAAPVKAAPVKAAPVKVAAAQPTAPAVALGGPGADMLADLDAMAGGFVAERKLPQLSRRRRRGLNANWTSAAILGVLAGVVVSGFFVLSFLMRDTSFSELWQKLITSPSIEAPSPPAAGPAGPAAPAPAAPMPGKS